MILTNTITDKSIIAKVKQLGTVKWDATRKEVVAYRKELLRAQGGVCAYCRRIIRRDELGHREIDHVLPKSQSPSDDQKFNPVTAQSNERSDRRHTRGFEAFIHTPENLVIACKRCNSHKGSYDGLADRAVNPPTYPNLSCEFEWINPHFDVVEDYLDVSEGFVYSAIDGSEKASAVIHACGLDKPEELNARALDHLRFSHTTLFNAMLRLALDDPYISLHDAAVLLEQRHPGVDAKAIEDCLEILIPAVDNPSDLQVASGKVHRILAELRGDIPIDAAAVAGAPDHEVKTDV